MWETNQGHNGRERLFYSEVKRECVTQSCVQCKKKMLHTHIKNAIQYKSYLGFQSRFKKFFSKGWHVQKKCWFCDCVSPKKAQGYKSAWRGIWNDKDKKEKTMTERSQKTGSQGQEMKYVIQHSKLAEIKTEAPVWRCADAVRKKRTHCNRNSYNNACTLWMRLPYCHMTHLKKIKLFNRS